MLASRRHVRRKREIRRVIETINKNNESREKEKKKRKMERKKGQGAWRRMLRASISNLAPLRAFSTTRLARLSNYVNRFSYFFLRDDSFLFYVIFTLLLFLFIYSFIFFLVEAIYYFKWHCFYNIDRLPWKKILQFPTRIFSFSLSLLLVHHDNETMIIRFKWHTLASVVLFFLLRLFFFN